MPTKIGNTVQNDSEMVWTVNGDITGGSAKAFVQDVNGVVTEVAATIVGARQVAIDTSSLPLGRFGLQVQVVRGGKKFSYPDNGLVYFNVNVDLGE